ncbi:UvrD-helicase domain-containing protein [Mycolicibacterium arenosum]|uniref:ATP-dependent helicase n=1 Tax=Mycolicibacterium arenosum TaxID=2952157 RepID=A0ABT1M6I7_9MYCO|nr:ATP-dependent helicase [Mycolicibacterium sp. CAU 1645]MCP9274052.1 ATP-dependent helicase [Mycolicibacterium sp. CAU 1645]
MITRTEFFRCHQEALGFAPDKEKHGAIAASADATLYVVAGPGTGKTACLAARILKLMLVDDVPPDGIVATTFTTKAAAELRSRVLDWGFRMTGQLADDKRLSKAKRAAASSLDINQVVTGTIDSLCQDMLLRYRDPGNQPPVVVDEFVAKTLLLRNGLFEDGRYKSNRFDELLMRLGARATRFGWNVGTKADILSAAADRIIHDRVDTKKYSGVRSIDEKYKRDKLLSAVRSYATNLGERMMLDYPRVEQEALTRLEAGGLSTFLKRVRAVLVDEYQDTNLVQEQIYFQLAKACGGALTVVGDDDQSLYRFRGATVELFSRFGERTSGEGWIAKPIFLQTNYRSSERVVRFVDRYARMDAQYQTVRAKSKPPLKTPMSAGAGPPVLAMFRDTTEELAEDLAGVINEVFDGEGLSIPGFGRIRRDRNAGSVGDAALLCSSPRETRNGTPALPGLLRTSLSRDHRIKTFNPRGQALHDVDVVAILGGALLTCLDPDQRIETAVFLTNPTRSTFQCWRQATREAKTFQKNAGQIIKGWEARDRSRKWPERVSALELLYSLSAFLPDLRDDPEGQVYLEAFARQLSACEQVSNFGGRVLTSSDGNTDAKGLSMADHSVRDLLQHFLGPIAAGAVDVNEDLIEDFPRNRLPVLSIHQAKGLEFPLTIVDVGSSFKSNHQGHRFKRFPISPTSAQAMEDHFRPYTPLGAPQRSGVDRAFDDLYRQYFVAFSRARDVLLLVALNAARPDGAIANVAMGWCRDGTSTWAADPPYVEI